jgi:hypothetical protein
MILYQNRSLPRGASNQRCFTSPRNPSNMIRIFSSVEYFLRVLRMIWRMIDAGPVFALIVSSSVIKRIYKNDILAQSSPKLTGGEGCCLPLIDILAEMMGTDMVEPECNSILTAIYGEGSTGRQFLKQGRLPPACN